MLIDWFTIIAQIINFLLLIFLLHRFLYKPIVKTIQKRQKEIEHNWQEVQEKEKTVDAEIAEYQEKQQDLEDRKNDIMAQAKQKAEQEYQHLLKEAHQNVEQQKQNWKKALAQQQEHFFGNLQQKITMQVFQIVRHAFQELANVQLEKQAIATFIHRLENLDEQKRQSLAECLQASDNGLLIRSSFELSSESHQKIIDSLQEQEIYQENKVQFATAPDLICGIELQSDDYKVAWNLQNYVQSLEQNLANDFPQKQIN